MQKIETINNFYVKKVRV